MSISQLYDSTRATIMQRLPLIGTHHTDTVAAILVGVIQSVSSQLGQIARAMPLQTLQTSKEQRLRRFLDTATVTPQTHYQPFVRHALHGLTGQRVHLILDRVCLRDQHNVLVVSLGFRRRSIPLTWRCLPHQGKSTLTDQQELLKAAANLVPPSVRITVHGDSEFRACALFAWIRMQGWNALLGIYGNTTVTVAETATPVQSVAAWLRDQSTVLYRNEVLLTEDRYGPVNVIAWWQKGSDGRWMVHGVMTNLPATWQTYRLGRRRMWIETVFRDWQSGGFQVDRTGIQDRERLMRLILILCIAYVWFVALGRWVVKKGYRRLVDDGSPHAWKYSLFQLGVAWKIRLATFNQSIPIQWTLLL